MTYLHIGDTERRTLLSSAPHGTQLFPAGTWALGRAATQISIEALTFGMHPVSVAMILDHGRVVVGDDGTIQHFQIFIVATSVQSGSARRDDQLRGPRFLDTAQHPDIHFAGRGSRERITGMLAVKEERATMTLTVTSAELQAPDTASFSAVGTVDRRAIGLSGLPNFLIGHHLKVSVSGIVSRC